MSGWRFLVLKTRWIRIEASDWGTGDLLGEVVAPKVRNVLAQGLRPWAKLCRRFAAENCPTSRLAQQQVHDPAAADVCARLAAVGEDGGVGAAGVFEGVGQDRQVVEGAVVVDV